MDFPAVCAAGLSSLNLVSKMLDGSLDADLFDLVIDLDHQMLRATAPVARLNAGGQVVARGVETVDIHFTAGGALQTVTYNDMSSLWFRPALRALTWLCQVSLHRKPRNLSRPGARRCAPPST
jgi:hypothetical protein